MESAEKEAILARRARREARRAAQRVANVGRAKKMHDARLAFEREGGGAPLSANIKSAVASRKIFVGCSGWYYWHWRGTFYPRDIPGSKWFEHYAGEFQTVELNAPFYSWPTIATVNTWIRQAKDPNFVYTIKACELITHVKRFSRTRTLVADFSFIADLLGPRMGCFLFQLPPSFHYTPARLKRIVEQLDPSRRNVLEFRHRSWWNERVYAAFRKTGTIFCSCSGPRLPDELVKTADDIYIRFHGAQKWYRHDYSRAELEVWAKRIRASNAKRVWVYFNNDRNGHAIKNAKELIRQLHGKGKPSAKRGRDTEMN